jgi:phage-related minor tail protein
MVGERGPEMFVPKNAGTIVPNSAMGGSNITQVTYNIQAADAASFRQMIARDPEFLYAVTERGRSNIPSGRR